ncbi:MAG: hypothetical protein ACI4TJ_03285 [Candidatus Cryptobacteroides sp.]
MLFILERDNIFKDGYCIAPRYKGVVHYAMLRKDGCPALDWGYTRIDEPRYGLRIVGKEEGCWLLDSTLNKVLPDVYDAISFSSGEGLT